MQDILLYMIAQMLQNIHSEHSNDTSKRTDDSAASYNIRWRRIA
jgi:hypothetical protein